MPQLSRLQTPRQPAQPAQHQAPVQVAQHQAPAQPDQHQAPAQPLGDKELEVLLHILVEQDVDDMTLEEAFLKVGAENLEEALRLAGEALQPQVETERSDGEGVCQLDQQEGTATATAPLARERVCVSAPACLPAFLQTFLPVCVRCERVRARVSKRVDTTPPDHPSLASLGDQHTQLRLEWNQRCD
ncbi:hypothetical protein UPYG_G00232660 [Umbra pygmaea]|uniref:Uncharacterized protein n=1 Tax=Umbra pygmaea TaxID=75934 RepID=A0ABD0WY28_UMBPY